MNIEWQNIFPGVWKKRLGNPEITLTGVANTDPVKHLSELCEMELPGNYACERFGDYTVLRIPLREGDRVFGGGLLFKNVVSMHTVYHLRVDHYAGFEIGNTHAPVPFLAISNGLGIFCDTQEEVSYYIGTAQRREDNMTVLQISIGVVITPHFFLKSQ